MSVAPEKPVSKRIGVRPASGVFGAEITGVNLSLPLDDETFAEIEQAFYDHAVIFFRDQDIEPGHQHIDLIYFARTVDDRPPKVNQREAARLRWCTWDSLAAEDIKEDIRVLGRQAIEAVTETSARGGSHA